MPPLRLPSERGMTLLEMLIVLAVIAVVSGATVLALTPQRGNATEAAAQQLARAVQSAADRALVTGRDGALVADAGGYAIDGTRHDLPAGIVLAASSAPLPVGLDAPFALTLAAGSDRWQVDFDGIRATAARAGPAA